MSRPTGRVTDREIVGRLRFALLSAIVGLFPFTVYSTFLVPIAERADIDVASAGALRGLGGVAALLTGAVVAPVLGRWAGSRAAAISLLLLAAAAMLGTAGTLPALIGFCLGIGVATAILTPVLLSTATSTFPDRETSSRAATLVTATQSLAAVLAGPVIGVLAWWRGWTGALWATAVLAIALAGTGFRSRTAERLAPPEPSTGTDPATPPGATADRGTPSTPAPPFAGYRAGLRALAGRRDLLALAGLAALRTTAFMGYLSFLAGFYDAEFALDPGAFTLVWTLSGGSFFLGNYGCGRWAGLLGTVGSRRLLLAGLAGSLVSVIMVFHADRWWVALAGTAGMGLCHAVVAALITGQIARTAGDLTTSAFSITAAGMSAGVFAGASLGALGLAAGGYTGLSLALAVPSLIAVWIAARMRWS